jgi:hypothetical protein
MLSELRTQRVTELLRSYAEIIQELTKREICRSTNNPVADIAELIVVRALGLTQAKRSMKGYDAVDAAGKRYEIKGRRITAHNGSRMLSAIRDCESAHFDYLAGVLFNEDFSLRGACLVPFNIVLDRSTYRKHTNAHIFELKDELWHMTGVVDVTCQVASAFAALDLAIESASNSKLAATLSGCLWCETEKQSSRRLELGERRECPLCVHVFKGHGWDGVDAHWRSKHEYYLPYEDFWKRLCRRHRG